MLNMASSSTDIDGLEQLMNELVEICESKDLSIESLQAKIKLLPSQISSAYVHHYSSRPFFHAACMNKNITMEIIEYILDSFPLVQNLPTAYFCPEGTTVSYALHCACYNDYCPNEVVELLVKNNSVALNHFCLVGDGVQCEDYDDYIRGLPLHYYLERTNVGIDTVKMLVEECPQTLGDVGDMSVPLIHVALSNRNININGLYDIITFFIQQSPPMMRMLDRSDLTPLHRVCRIGGLSLELFQLVFNAWPEAIQIGDDYAFLPIHELCCHKQLDDTASLDILRFMLNIDPTLLRETDDGGHLPVHHAVTGKSFAFCKILIDEYPESMKIGAVGGGGELPIHRACRWGTREDTVYTIQYLLELHPECLHARDNMGWLPIHNAAAGGDTKAIELMLMHDPNAASKESTGEKPQLPLHIACNTGKEHLDTVKALFDAFPEAILTRNQDGKTPIDLAWADYIVDFLQVQLEYARTTQDTTIMTTFDANGWLPLHHALKDNAPLGSIRLLVKGNPSAVQTADSKFAFPLHIACEFSSVQVVQYLVEAYSRSVDHCDDNKDSILHYACRGGNLGVVKYLLKSQAHLVASATVNAKGELPIHLLCESGKGVEDDIESAEYIEAIWQLLLVNPEVALA